MAELTLKLTVDPVTGKRTVVADYRSDADALPMEHEDAHRRLVRSLVDADLAQLDVDRNPDTAPAERPAEDATAEREGQKQGG